MIILHEAERRLNFADFLVSRSSPETYASAAFKHVLVAATILVKEITNLDDNLVNSPQLVAKSFKKFNDPKAAKFSKFYINLLKTSSKSQIPVADVEQAIRDARDFMQWVKEHIVNSDTLPNATKHF